MPLREGETRHVRMFITSRHPTKRRLLWAPPNAKTVCMPWPRKRMRSHTSASLKSPLATTKPVSLQSMGLLPPFYWGMGGKVMVRTWPERPLSCSS